MENKLKSKQEYNNSITLITESHIIDFITVSGEGELNKTSGKFGETHASATTTKFSKPH